MILVSMKDDRPKLKKPHKLLRHLNPTAARAGNPATQELVRAQRDRAL